MSMAVLKGQSVLERLHPDYRDEQLGVKRETAAPIFIHHLSGEPGLSLSVLQWGSLLFTIYFALSIFDFRKARSLFKIQDSAVFLIHKRG